MMTWTVESKNAVTGEGFPPGMGAQYSCTYQKGTVRAGDEAVLALTHMQDMTVDRVEVYMRSNKSSGAGVITITINGEERAYKEGTFRDWTGAYDNSDYHPIAVLEERFEGVQELTISVKGTTNSLYIEKYVISYTPAQAKTVTLMAGNNVYGSLSETQGGAGVILPAAPDTAQWIFMGWSETEFGEIHETPVLLASGSLFMPSEDCTLWAVYGGKEENEAQVVTELVNGKYRYVNRDSRKTLTGLPENGKMQAGTLNPSDEDQEYTFTFTDNNTAYITHTRTGQPIGRQGTGMAIQASEWSVYHEGEETLFYTTIGGKNYVLWLNIYVAKDQPTYAGLLQADPMTSPMVLMIAQPETGPVYTCHPEHPQGMETIRTDGHEYRFPFGPYELVIKNGQKQLRR